MLQCAASQALVWLVTRSPSGSHISLLCTFKFCTNCEETFTAKKQIKRRQHTGQRSIQIQLINTTEMVMIKSCLSGFAAILGTSPFGGFTFLKQMCRHSMIQRQKAIQAVFQKVKINEVVSAVSLTRLSPLSGRASLASNYFYSLCEILCCF